jgi:hypothetical protein
MQIEQGEAASNLKTAPDGRFGPVEGNLEGIKFLGL